MHVLIRILVLLLLTNLIASCEQPGKESPTPPASKEDAEPSPTLSALPQSFIVDIPSLLNKDAQQVKTMMEAHHGAPDYAYSKPSKGTPGTMAWTVQSFQFGFLYYQNGDIGSKREGRLAFRGFPQAGHTVEGMMQAGNLIKDSRDYVLEINDFEDLIEIIIIPVRK